jgi:hypothetical protein
MNINALSAKYLFVIFLPLFTVGYGQASITVPGTWVKENFNDNAEGCPGLTIDRQDNPIVVALTRIQYGDVDEELFVLRGNVKNIDGEWAETYNALNLDAFRDHTDNLLVRLTDNHNLLAAFTEGKGVIRWAYGNEQFLNVDSKKAAYAIWAEFDSQERVVVTWSESNGIGDNDFFFRDSAIFVRRWSSDVLEKIGTPLVGHALRLALDSQDLPYLTYFREVGNNIELVVVYWDGQSWQQIGEPFVVNWEDGTDYFGYGNATLLLDDNGTPIISFRDRSGLFIKRWDGTKWQGLGEDTAIEPGHEFGLASFDYRDGTLVMAISEGEPQKPGQLLEDLPHYFYVKEWDGTK